MDTVVFNKVATFNIDFASHDSKNRMNKNVRQPTERKLHRSKKSLVMS